MSEPRQYRLQAVVLQASDYKDTDKRVTLFSVEQGKVIALAKGARKPAASLRAGVQPFCRGSYHLARSRYGWDIITQALQEQGFPGIYGDLHKMAYAAYLSELVALCCPPGKPFPGLFPVLLAAYSLVEWGEVRQAARYVELQLLAALGLLPSLAHCAHCGSGIRGEHFVLEPQAGALLCRSCAGASAAPPLSAGAVLTMRRLLDCEIGRLNTIKLSPVIAAELAAALRYYFRWQLPESEPAYHILTQFGAEPQ